MSLYFQVCSRWRTKNVMCQIWIYCLYYIPIYGPMHSSSIYDWNSWRWMEQYTFINIVVTGTILYAACYNTWFLYDTLVSFSSLFCTGPLSVRPCVTLSQKVLNMLLFTACVCFRHGHIVNRFHHAELNACVSCCCIRNKLRVNVIVWCSLLWPIFLEMGNDETHRN
jgi:hypothetical protein